MHMRHLLYTTALAAGLGLTGATAQTQGQPNEAQATGQPAGVQSGSDQRLAQESARAEGTQIYLGTAGTRQIQQALNSAGYDVGNVDGKWDDQTSTAAANFQQASGLEPTGTLTVGLVNALGMRNLLSGAECGGQADQRLQQEAAAGEGTPLHVSPAGVRQIEQALNDKGYDAGDVDGTWNDQARTAAINFQQAQGLEPTGQIDVGLIAALGVSGEVFSEGSDVTAGAQTGNADQRLAQESARVEGTPLYFGPAGVRQITQALNTQGYDAGNVDGAWDEQTSTAAANFQQASSLEPTGTLTTSLLCGIGMANWMEPTQGGAQKASTQQGATGTQQSSASTSGTGTVQSAATAGSASGSTTQAGGDARASTTGAEVTTLETGGGASATLGTGGGAMTATVETGGTRGATSSEIVETETVAVETLATGTGPLYERPVSEIVGQSLVNARGETLGEVGDVAIDEDRQAVVVVEVGGVFGIGGKRVPVAVDELEYEGDQLVWPTEMGENEIAETGEFDAERYEVVEGERMLGEFY